MNSIRDAYQIFQAKVSSEVPTNLRQSITPLALAGNLSNEIAQTTWTRTANFFSITGKTFLFLTNAALLEKSYGVLKENYGPIRLESDYQHKLFLTVKAAGQFLENFLPVFDVSYSLANRYIVNIPFLGVILDGAKVLYAISPAVLAVSDGEKEIDRALRQFCELASKDFSEDIRKNERELLGFYFQIAKLSPESQETAAKIVSEKIRLEALNDLYFENTQGIDFAAQSEALNFLRGALKNNPRFLDSDFRAAYDAMMKLQNLSGVQRGYRVDLNENFYTLSKRPHYFQDASDTYVGKIAEEQHRIGQWRFLDAPFVKKCLKEAFPSIEDGLLDTKIELLPNSLRQEVSSDHVALFKEIYIEVHKRASKANIEKLSEQIFPKKEIGSSASKEANYSEKAKAVAVAGIGIIHIGSKYLAGPNSRIYTFSQGLIQAMVALNLVEFAWKKFSKANEVV